MNTPSPARGLSARPMRASAPRIEGLLAFSDDQVFAKLHGVGVQAALAVLLSVFGLGSAMGQSVAPDMALGANTQATRDRVIAEIRQARADGTIKRWSPVFVEFPPKAAVRGSRFAPIAVHQQDTATSRDAPGPRASELSPAAPRPAE